MSGTLYGLGVGPGDPELVTLKAVRVARRVPVIAYPAPEHGESLARRIMASHLPGGQIELPIRMALDPARFPDARVYRDAADALAAHLDAGKDVGVLCLGDPLLYGSFMYLLALLADRYKVEVVPGITSIAASSALLHHPLAAREDAFAVIPATLNDVRIEALLGAADAAAILKLGRHFARIRALLQRTGLAAAARYVERAGLDRERIVPLDQVDPDSVPYFALILVHRRGAAVTP